jgi:hypothetical protein
MPVDHSPQPQQMQIHHQPFQQIPHEPQYVSSRVCTPAPEAIDPFLDASPMAMPMVAPMVSQGAFLQSHTGDDTPSVTIKMGVDELRTMITEVVQKAVQGLQVGTSNSTTTVDVAAQELTVEGAMERMQANESAACVNTLTGLEAGDKVVVAAAAAAAVDVVCDVQDETDLWSAMKE